MSSRKSVLLLERDMVRKLILPAERPMENSKVVLTTQQYNYIKEKSQKQIGETYRDGKLKNTDKTKLSIEIEQKKIQSQNQEIKRLQYQRNLEKGKYLEESKNKEFVLLRNKELLYENEEQIKRCNSLIMNAKCRTIQDAQVREKHIISKELEMEDRKMEELMQKERRKTLKNAQKSKEIEWGKKQEYSSSVMAQIQENELLQQREADRIKTEGSIIRKAAMKSQIEENEKIRQRILLEKKIKSENEKINDEMKKLNDAQRQKDQQESLKFQEYIQEQANDKDKKEILQKKVKQAEEKELSQLWMLQKKTQDLEDLKEEIINQKIQDQIDREWQQKEIESVRKKIQSDEEIRRIRDSQIIEKHKELALQIANKNQEAEVIKQELNNVAKDQEFDKINHKRKIEDQKNALIRQIIEKKEAKARLKEELLQESNKIKADIRKHEESIKEAIKKKIDLIRKTSIPEKYIREIEKHLQIR